MEAISEERPLVTFAVFAYRQEAFVREAIIAAFSQTYSPLQIILSDDCSNDKTFEIMEEMASEYNGPHSIVLNRNPKNLGIGSHINRIVELAQGRLIMPAAGDDISYPERSEIIVREWIHSGKKASALISAYEEMDANGVPGEIRSNTPPNGTLLLDRVRIWNSNVGCSEAFTKDIWEKFGPLSPDILSEDSAIFFRSWAIAPVIHIPKPLVRYRIHSSAVSSQVGADLTAKESISRHKRLLQGRVATFKQYLLDLSAPIVTEHSSEVEIIEAKRIVSDEIRSTLYALSFLLADRSLRLRLLCDLVSRGAPISRVISWILRIVFPVIDVVKLRSHGRR